MPTALVILAAGKGTRMQSDLPKVLHQVASGSLLEHAMRSGDELEPERTIIVAGHEAEMVEEAAQAINPEAVVVVQEEQLGTAHAVEQARVDLADFKGDVIVLYGDTPFIEPETLEKMLTVRGRGDSVVVLGFETDEPGRYGRLIVDETGRLDAIVEAKDATDEQLAITLCNSGVICADSTTLFDLITKIGNENAAEEYYLTDVVALANAEGLSCSVVTCPIAETVGVNSRADLAAAEAAFQADARAKAMDGGASLIAPDTVYFAYDTYVGRDALIEPNVVFGPGVTVENGAHIRAFSHLEGCHVSEGAVVGPYARLRPGTEIAENAKVGNFVEVKNADVAKGAKINHLSYVGDASVGEGANIGAGTITCNYDGVMKHRTEIGARTFVGSNTVLIAPVKVGADAMTAAGSVITKDVPDAALAIARTPQLNKAGLATKLRQKLLAIKAQLAKKD